MIELTIALILASLSCFAVFLIQAFQDRELQRWKKNSRVEDLKFGCEANSLASKPYAIGTKIAGRFLSQVVALRNLWQKKKIILLIFPTFKWKLN